MKVILLERVEGTGVLGDVVTVKDGFARNFLLPRHKALRANEANKKFFEGQRAQDRLQGRASAAALHFGARQDRSEPHHRGVGEEAARVGPGHQTRPLPRPPALRDPLILRITPALRGGRKITEIADAGNFRIRQLGRSSIRL